MRNHARLLLFVTALGSGRPASAAPADSVSWLAPSQSGVYREGPGLSVGGYGEMLYQNFARSREDGAPSGLLDRIDFPRLAVVLGYRFDDQLLINTEVDVEHAGGSGRARVSGTVDPLDNTTQGEAAIDGRVALGFAYLEWSRDKMFGARVGLLPIPVGIANEYHDPPLSIGARGSEVEQATLPAPWRAAGAGVFGEVRSIAWRLYLTEGLDAARFTAAGIAAGRQDGAGALATQPLVSLRADYSAHPECVVGASLATGNTWQQFQPGLSDLAPRLTLFDLHARTRWRGLDARALYAHGTLTQAGDLSDALGLTGSARLGKSSFGAYAEASYDVLPLWRPGTPSALSPYLRWERYDTQVDVPGGTEDDALERTVVTAGLAFHPRREVVVKSDYQWKSSPAATETDQWNLAVGYAF